MAGLTPTFAAVVDLAGRAGLRHRGAFHAIEEDAVPGPAATVVLLGFVGGEGWETFATSVEAQDGRRDPLDRWSRRTIDGIASQLGASALYPFAGPPWLPFQRWAQRGDRVFASPLGILIHPDWGLWHSYRGALVFGDRLDLPATPERASPCASCLDKPCLMHCPVSAFSTAGFDVDRCVRHISAPEGGRCMSGGCLARRACPVGAELRYMPGQAGFHMSAFLRTRSASARR